MKRKIGVMIESFRLGVRPGIDKAASLGADGFQIYVTGGEVAPENMNTEARKDFVKYVSDSGLVISALCADYGHGFMDKDKNPELIAKSKACVDLAVDLGTSVITTHIGHVPENEEDEKYLVCLEAISNLAEYAAKNGVVFATETGPESPADLAKFMNKVGSAGAKVNYDPANLVMSGFDHLGGVKILAPFIAHTHAKDGVRKEGFADEVALGEGQVDFPKYITALDEVGYNGFLTIEREVGPDPEGDIRKAIEFLRTL